MDPKAILAKMTLVEKIRLCSGKDAWQTEDFPHLDIPSIRFSDGPHGVRKTSGKEDHLGLFDSEKAVAFPTASLSACSWDVDLLYEMGQALGEECLTLNVDVLLGPGVNMKRSPLCGRNFEYFSEDPVLAGNLAAAWIHGVQSKGIGASLKHFAANNQETNRMTSSSNIDDRALHDLYLRPFEIAIKQANPWTVMCSYNRINGVSSSKNSWLLSDTLKSAWNFDGAVISDWGAGHDRSEDIAAGMDLEMPGNQQYYLSSVVKAIQTGKLSEARLNESALRMLKLIQKCVDKDNKLTSYDIDTHRLLARKIAQSSIVLLKNDTQLLPLSHSEPIFVIGELAKIPRYQGSGSSRIHPHHVESLLDGLDEAKIQYTYLAGYSIERLEDFKGIEQAASSILPDQTVIVFVGLTDKYEREGFDRTSMHLPSVHDRLIEAVCAKTKNVVVVLANGSPVSMPWEPNVSSILEGYLPGEAGGPALVDVLFGKVNPSGKLAESFPIDDEAVVCFPHFGIERNQVNYRESIFTGYRYFDANPHLVRFPFGHGLSYSTFRYSNLQQNEMSISFDLTNLGPYAGSEIVQLYIQNPSRADFFPRQELKRFAKVNLNVNETRKVTFTLNEEDFRYYSNKHKRSRVVAGEYEIRISSSSTDIRFRLKLHVDGEMDDVTENNPKSWHDDPIGKPRDIDFERLAGKPIPKEMATPKGSFTLDSTFDEMRETWIGRRMLKAVDRMLCEAVKKPRSEIDDDEFEVMRSYALTTPLRNLILMSNGTFKESLATGIVHLANGKGIQALISFLKKK